MKSTSRRVLLRNGSRGKEDLEAASQLLACSLEGLSQQVERMIHREQADARRWLRLGVLSRLSRAIRDASPAESGKVLRRMRRIAKQPLPHARRQIRRLVTLLDGGEFRQLLVSRDSVIARVGPAPLRPTEKPIAPFRIGFVPASRQFFPMVIRLDTPIGTDLVFQRLGGHGECWGEARPLLETATEEADVYHMFIIAFTWALQNLPRGQRPPRTWEL